MRRSFNEKTPRCLSATRNRRHFRGTRGGWIIGASLGITGIGAWMFGGLSLLLDYTTLVLCPDADQLIYPAFTCTDRLRMENGQ